MSAHLDDDTSLLRRPHITCPTVVFCCLDVFIFSFVSEGGGFAINTASNTNIFVALGWGGNSAKKVTGTRVSNTEDVSDETYFGLRWGTKQAETAWE